MRSARRTPARSLAACSLGALAVLVLPDAARAHWGTANWGEFAWGQDLPIVPLLEPVGLMVLWVAVLGLGAWWLRSGGRRRTPSGRPSRSQQEGAMLVVEPRSEGPAMDDNERALIERIAELERIVDDLSRRSSRMGRPWTAWKPARPWLRGFILGSVLLVSLAAYASMLSVPYTFVNGTTADANEVNANFAAVESAVNDNDSRISALEGAPAPGDITAVSAGSGLLGGGVSGAVVLSVDTASIQSRVSGTCAAGSSIRAIDPNGDVVCELDDVGAGGGDITEVVAGTGLTGGGTSGSVSLAVATGGITSTHIADHSILGNDISIAAAPTIASLTVSGSADVNGTFEAAGISVTAGQGLTLFDTASVKKLTLVNDPNDKSLYDHDAARYVFRSTPDGVGIGTSPTAGADVTISSLQVTGTTGVGLEIVSATYPLASSSACPTYGPLGTCWTGYGTAVCPTGKKVIGGGIRVGVTSDSYSADSYPSNDHTWHCESASTNGLLPDECYAVCARLD